MKFVAVLFAAIAFSCVSIISADPIWPAMYGIECFVSPCPSDIALPTPRDPESGPEPEAGAAADPDTDNTIN